MWGPHVKKKKSFLTIAKQKKKGTLCSKSASWLKLELHLRPWPQLFYPFLCREVPLGHWLILYWMGYRPLTYLIPASGPEHNSLFIGASKKVMWICRLLKLKLKPKAFHSNQFSKMYSPGVDGECSHRNMLHWLTFIQIHVFTYMGQLYPCNLLWITSL